MGGEELKSFTCVLSMQVLLVLRTLLLLGAGLLIQIQIISAQDISLPEEEQPVFEELEPFIDPRAAEHDITLGTGSGDFSPAAENSVWIIIRMILTLALSAVAIYGIVFLIKRSGKKVINKDPFLKVLASTSLTSNRHAFVISVGNQAWVVGASDGGINLIGELTDKDILNAMLLEDSEKSANAPQGKFVDFISMLRRMGVKTETGAPGADDIRKRRERLKGL